MWLAVKALLLQYLGNYTAIALSCIAAALLFESQHSTVAVQMFILQYLA
jgi:hypothetical protein